MGGSDDDGRDYLPEGDDETRIAEDSQEAARRKARVGMAPYGTPEYYRNAAYILRSYRVPNAETRAKLRALENMGY
jgi:hypothetical protein